MPPSESSPFQHCRCTSQDSQCALQKRGSVSESVRNLPGVAPEPPPSRSVFSTPRVTVCRSNHHENASFHTGFDARTRIYGVRIRWGRDTGQERRRLREGWRYLGCRNKRLHREKDVDSTFCLHCAEERRLPVGAPSFWGQALHFRCKCCRGTTLDLPQAAMILRVGSRHTANAPRP